MSRLRQLWPRDRRRAQAGATLVELLVSLVIIGLALVLIVGTLSTGLFSATLTKRNSAGTAVVQYELDQISGGAYNASAQSYSDCFATENASSPPATLTSFQGACPDISYALRADLTVGPGPSPNTQVWSITVSSWPSAAVVGSVVQVIKVNR